MPPVEAGRNDQNNAPPAGVINLGPGLSFANNTFYSLGVPLSKEQAANLPISLLESCQNPEPLDCWMDLNSERMVNVAGKVTSTRSSEDLIEEFAKIFGQALGLLVDTGSIRLSNDRTMTVTIMKRERLVEWKEKTKHLVNWFDDNRAEGFGKDEIGISIAVFGTIARARFDGEHVGGFLNSYILVKIGIPEGVRYVSIRPHVTSLFLKNMDVALFVTSHPIEYDSPVGRITLKFNMNLATKNKAKHIKIAELPEKVLTGNLVKARLNQILAIKGRRWSFILVDIMKNSSGQQLDYLYAYPQQDVDLNEVIKALEDLTICKKKVRVAIAVDRSAKPQQGGQQGNTTPQPLGGRPIRGGGYPIPPPTFN